MDLINWMENYVNWKLEAYKIAVCGGCQRHHQLPPSSCTHKHTSLPGFSCLWGKFTSLLILLKTVHHVFSTNCIEWLGHWDRCSFICKLTFFFSFFFTLTIINKVDHFSEIHCGLLPSPVIIMCDTCPHISESTLCQNLIYFCHKDWQKFPALFPSFFVNGSLFRVCFVSYRTTESKQMRVYHSSW